MIFCLNDAAMSIPIKNPLIKANQLLLLFILGTVVLFYGRIFLIPLVFGALLAMLMEPVCRKLDEKGWPRSASVTVSVLILLVVLLSVLTVIAVQVTSFREDLPKIEKKANQFFTEIQSLVQEKSGVSQKQQEEILKEQLKKTGQSATKFLGQIIGGVAGTIGGIALTLVYTFLFLYNKEQFRNFFLKLYEEQEQSRVKDILKKITNVSQQYLTGRAKSMIILAALYGIGLTIIGIENALLLAAIAALLTIIPYVGPFLGGLFPVLMALATEDSLQSALWVTGLLVLIQAIDNYFVEPNVIGDEVNLNALATILTVIAGGLIWGVAGMILFIPMLSISKIIFDHVEELHPYGYILGNTGKKSKSKIMIWIEHKFKKRGERT